MTAMWHTLVSSRDSKHMVKGTELECMNPDGFRSRFMIYAVRCYVANPSGMQPRTFSSMYYTVRDAERISDADVRAGKRPPIVGTYDTLDAALIAIERYRVIDTQ